MLQSLTISLLPIIAILSTSYAQQAILAPSAFAGRPQCAATASYSPPYYKTSVFSFPQPETPRTATSIASPTTTASYAAPYASLSSLLPSLKTRTWGSWDPNATFIATDYADPYGNAAWTGLWERASIVDYTFTGIYSTTVSPTPVPTSELILPPADYFGPTDCHFFPEDFIFGVAGSAGQIEGAAAAEGRTPTLLEKVVTDERPKNYVTNENYYLYKQDIERLASMGVEYYSLTIPWTRILPFVFEGTPVNKQGIEHYEDLINFVIEKGMTPTVTLFHFDTPLQFYGNISSVSDPVTIGYVNGAYQNDTFEDAFVNYGKIVLSHFADRVPIWFSFNEPLLHSANGKSINTVIKAHARLYHFYHDEVKATGKFGIKFNDNFGVPLDSSDPSHIDAANRVNELQLAPFCNPIYLGADYPDLYKQMISDYVPLNADDLAYIKGTADFLGIDPYTATVISPPSQGIDTCSADSSDPLYPYCVHQTQITNTGWNIGYGSQSYVYITPAHLRTYLSYLWNTFHSPIFVTEFGFPVFHESEKPHLSDQLFDTPRSIYYLSFMSEILKSIWEDHVHVMGALAWSFADNWEFGDYDSHFGLQAVNRTTQVRSYKKSFFDLVDFVAARRFRG